MPYHVVGGVTVSVAASSESVEEVGDRGRAFDGTLRSTIRARKKEWTISTVPMTQADATTLETALNGTLPVACSGDLTGTVNTHPVITGKEYVMVSGSYRVVTSYLLKEA